MLDLLDESPEVCRGVLKGRLAVKLASEIWNQCLENHPREAGFYLDYYSAKTDCLDLGRVRPGCHRDILAIVAFVKKGRTWTRSQLQDNLLDRRPPPSWLKTSDKTTARQAVEFGASLWLFVDVSDWREDETLSDFVKRTFTHSAAKSNKDANIHFNARMLHQIGGIELVWTSNLSKHLDFDLTDRKHPQLFLFRHGSYCGGQNDVSRDIFPARLLRETAETLALLFPFAESPQKRWDRRVRRRADLDVEAGVSCNTPRNLDHYLFWGTRLAQIQEAFDKSKPHSLAQWLHDKRDSDRFYTFWFAVAAIILTLFFGLIQSVTGIIQAVRY